MPQGIYPRIIPWNKGKTWEEVYGYEKAQEMKKIKRKLRKDKTWGEIFGENRVNEIREKISNALKGHLMYQCKERNKKISEHKIGHPMYKSREWRKNNSKARLGKHYSPKTEFKLGNNKGRTYEEIYGKEKAMKKKEKMRQSRLKYKPTQESIEKMREGLINYYKKNVHPMYGKHHNEETIEQIKEARSKQIVPKYDTKIEVKIQMFLEELGYEYFTHRYMKEIEHGYQCDILIPALNLVIECDGDYWHKYPIGKDIDHIRTKELLEKGFKVLRLWECEINEMSINKFKEDLDITKREI